MVTRPNGNYIQLLMQCDEDNSRMFEWLFKPKIEKYTCVEVQNEILQMMALSILMGDGAQNIRNYVNYSIMAHEMTDVSNRKECLETIS